VPAGDRNARGVAHRLTASDDPLDHVDRKLPDRHTEQRERHERRCPHRVHVRDRVGRRNAPEVERIVDDGRKKIGCRNDRLRVVEPIDRRIVARFVSDEQVRESAQRRGFRKNLAQQRWRELAASAAAVRELRETESTRFERLVHRLP
jgi:hypothetical protein